MKRPAGQVHMKRPAANALERATETPVLKRPCASRVRASSCPPTATANSATQNGRVCGNCGATGHRADGCPEMCFACGEDHCYLYCTSLKARDRAAKNRAQWMGGRARKEPLVGDKTRQGKEWLRQPWDPVFDPPSAAKQQRLKESSAQCFDFISLASLMKQDTDTLSDNMVEWTYLQKPGPCSKCGKDVHYEDRDGKTGRWVCTRSCRAIYHSAFQGSVFEECHVAGEEKDTTRISLDLYDAAGVGWCFAHDVDTTLACKLTGVPQRTVQKWYSGLRQMIKTREQAYQNTLVFSSEGCENGYCHLQGDATRIKKSHHRDARNAITSTDHCSACVLLQQNSLKAVVRAMPKATVAVGTDGKPGAPPPEKDAFVYRMVSDFASSVDYMAHCSFASSFELVGDLEIMAFRNACKILI